MANSKSALKRVRQNKTRSERNKVLKTRVKNLRKKVVVAASEGKADIAQSAFTKFTSAVDKCLKKKIIHKNKAANLKSKTAKAIVAAAK